MSTMKVKIVHDERSTLMKRKINCAIIDDRDGSSGASEIIFIAQPSSDSDQAVNVKSTILCLRCTPANTHSIDINSI